MLHNMCFSKSTQKNHSKKVLKNLMLTRISLFHKRLIKMAIYTLVYDSFLLKGSVFVY